MNETEKRYYFAAVKLCCIIILIIYFISSRERSLNAISREWFLLAVTMVAVLGFELTRKEFAGAGQKTEKRFEVAGWFKVNWQSLFFLVIEIILTVVLILFYKESGCGLYLFPLVVLDSVLFFGLPFVWGLLAFVGVFLSPDNVNIYMFNCLFLLIIYLQNFVIIARYRRYMTEFEKEEYQLKDSINSQDTTYKEELKKSSLAFENRMLEEKTRLSQALHDKLGHSINGSIYQLEACKVLMEKEPEQSAEIMQGVIDNLRTCMDEIRIILRREKPDKRRMAYLQLVQLCEECREKYGIQADFRIQGEDKQLPEPIWEIILDNAIEAVTNALKYSKCSEITIEIVILHKVVRCNIQDNGIGCDNLKAGMGIQGMQNRVRRAGGYIDITCDSGFRINMIIPLEEMAL
jgi:signal transduction histidine kinase